MSDRSRYANLNIVHGFQVCEVLSFEPVPIKRIVDRINTSKLPGEKLGTDKIFRVLCTLEVLGYARYDEQGKKWARGTKRIF
jgi:hypothetical protein